MDVPLAQVDRYILAGEEGMYVSNVCMYVWFVCMVVCMYTVLVKGKIKGWIVVMYDRYENVTIKECVDKG